MEYLGFPMNELGLNDQECRPVGGRMGRRRVAYDDTVGYKSKNLHAERRRREKLSNRLLTLRSLVPIITNMNKGTIIEDAITYIQELQKNVQVLSDMLDELELEASSSAEEEIKTTVSEIDTSEEMKPCAIKENVEVTNIIGTDNLWIKIIIEKKTGGFTRLMEKLACFGLQLMDSNVTTSKGAMLVTACVQGGFGDTLTVQHAKELLLEIIKGI